MDTKQHGVFLHSSGEQGGYVVRTIWNGSAAAPYQLAQKMADKLNAPRFGGVS